ncbi:MAG: hypothetical protein JKY54_19000 [Flavobacteriales bacterium]|nr:hypothetical protein [Flavobacteriales bacterium]
MNVTSTQVVIAAQAPQPNSKWAFSNVDLNLFPVVLRGTWIFDHQLDGKDLQQGLSTLLSYYPHLAGRMKGRKIVLSNQGVLFICASNPALSREDLRKDHSLAKRVSAPLSRIKIMLGESASMSVKLTMLKDGSVLSVRCSHACMDGFSFYTMMSDWGKICRGIDIDPPIIDQAVFPTFSNSKKDEAKSKAQAQGWYGISLSGLFRMLWLVSSGKAVSRSRPYYFSPDMIDKMKQELSEDDNKPFSSNTVLAALLANWLSSLLKHTDDTECSMTMVVDCRQRVACFPNKFIGNASSVLSFSIANANAGLKEVAESIHAALSRLRDPSSSAFSDQYWLLSELIYHRVTLMPCNVTEAFSKQPREYYLNNFTRFPIYEVDFSHGEPVLVIPHNLPDPVLIWPAPPEKGGFEVYLTGSLNIALIESEPQLRRITFGELAVDSI